MAIVPGEDSVISRFREELSAPMAAERDAGSNVHTRLIHGIGADHHIRSKRHLIEAEERVETRADGDARLCEVLVHAVIATATSYVEINRAFGDQVNNRIQCN